MADVSQIKLPNGSVYDLIDEKSGYITAEYIENKTDYEIPVSRVGEIVVGETAIGTDSTNFPTSKAVVDYVDERVVQEMDAIDVGVTGIKANGTSLSIVDRIVNIPAIGPDQPVGLMTNEYMFDIYDRINNVSNSIPTSTSQLTNNSGFITSETDPTVPSWAKASSKPTYTAGEVGALPSNTFIPQVFKVVYYSSTNTADKTYTEIDQAYNRGDLVLLRNGNNEIYQITSTSLGYLFTTVENLTRQTPTEGYNAKIKQLLVNPSNTWSTVDYKLPRKTSDLTNDSGYLTASDIASVMTYKGTKANYAALPASGNTTGDVWHLTDTGAEWAWDGSAWQELGTAIDLSNYATKATTLAGYGITDAKIENGTITLGSNTITPLTSFTETDPIFSASAAAGITSTDISNWNAKSSTDEKLKTITSSSNNTSYYPIFGTNNTSSASTKFIDTTSFMYYKDGTYTYLALGSSTTGAGSIILRNINNVDTTIKCSATTTGKTITFPNASGTIALTSDIPTKISELTNDSGFITSYTDEKLGLSLVSSPASYYPILTQDTTTAGKKSYDNDGFKYYNYNGTTSDVGNAKLTLGNNKTATTANNKRGTLELYGSTAYATRITAGAPTVIRNIEFPNKDGTIALTSDIPTVPTKVSDLTNDSGFISSYTETDPVFSASAAAGITATDISNWNGKAAGDHQHGNISNEGHITTYGSITSGSRLIFAKSNTWAVTMAPASMAFGSDSTKYLANDGTWQSIPDTSSFLTSETDPIFSASAAAGITSTDISNWNAKVSDDKTWNEVTLNKQTSSPTWNIYLPFVGGTNNGNAYYVTASTTPTANYISKYDANSYLYSTTPSANDNSTKVATTAYVDAAIPKVYSSTNTGGYLTMATLPIYDGTVV